MASSPKIGRPNGHSSRLRGAAVPPVPEAKTAAACARQVKQFQIINAVNFCQPNYSRERHSTCDTLLITVSQRCLLSRPVLANNSAPCSPRRADSKRPQKVR
jgi:hypothetical protein